MPIDFDHFPQLFDRVHVVLALSCAVLLTAILALIILLFKSRQARNGDPTQERARETPIPAPVVLKEASTDGALQLLSLLQQEARLVDFIQEDIKSYADADIGAAVRVVHEGCRRVFNAHLGLVSIRSESEGSSVTLPKGFDAGSIRVSGNVVGEPPFSGTLVHKGWVAQSISLPRISDGHDVRVIAPAEVEL